MWDNFGFVTSDGNQNKGLHPPPATLHPNHARKLSNIDMRGFSNVRTTTPNLAHLYGPNNKNIMNTQLHNRTETGDIDKKTEEDPEKCKKCCKRFLAIMLSHIGIFMIVFLYLLMGGFLFEYLEVGNEKSSCQQKYEKYKVKQDESVDRVYNIAQGLNATNSKNNILKEIYDFAKDVYTLNVNPSKNCTTIGESGNLPSWNIANAIYFCTTIVTTIGYGHIAPATKWGQIVCMIYAVLGIPIMLLFLSKIGGPTAILFRSFYLNICCCKCFLKKLPPPEVKDEPPVAHWTTVDESKPPPKVGEVLMIDDDEDDEEELENVNIPITVTILVLIIYILIGAAVFKIWETNWTLVEATYFSFITLATIGFGDYVPGKDGPFDDTNVTMELLVGGIYCIFGLALLSMCINLIQDEIAAKLTWIAHKMGVVTRQKRTTVSSIDSSSSEEDSSDDDEEEVKTVENNEQQKKVSAKKQINSSEA